LTLLDERHIILFNIRGELMRLATTLNNPLNSLKDKRFKESRCFARLFLLAFSNQLPAVSLMATEWLNADR
jgi:hypothetical protein